LKSFFKEITLFRLSLLFIIFFSGGIQIFSILISTLIPTILIFILYSKYKIVVIHKNIKAISFVVILYFSYAVFIANDLEDIKFVVFRLVRFMMAIFLLNFIYVKRVQFIDELYIVLKWLAIHGVFNFVIVYFLFKYFTFIPETNTSSIFVFFGPQNIEGLFRRNQGVFWEPGVFQIYLNVFLFINLFYRNSKNKFPVWIILALILTTVSTTGFFISFLLITYSYFFRSKITGKRIFVMIFTFPFVFLYSNYTIETVEKKISGNQNGSYLARNFDTLNGFTLAYNNPFGIGFSTAKYQEVAEKNLFKIDTEITTDRANTNSIAMLFYSTGFGWGIIFLILMYRQKVFLKNKFLFFLLIFFSLFSEPLFFTPFFLLFPLSGISKISDGLKNKKIKL
tara:strand:+ start:17499 stop:18683 length:1185 start_codon:yes stop_codon:yes gene_type:complete